jgi:hypothetical protein
MRDKTEETKGYLEQHKDKVRIEARKIQETYYQK